MSRGNVILVHRFLKKRKKLAAGLDCHMVTRRPARDWYPMKAALSNNEIVILDRQVADLSYQLSEIAGLLESRLGENNELATSARAAQQEFAKFAHRIRRRVALPETGRAESDSQIA
jgi:hypothetical protein